MLERRAGVRENGFNWPPDPLQILTYIIFVLDIVAYYLINMTSLSYSVPLVVICSIVYFVLSVVVVIFGFLATSIDPSDPTIRLHRIAKAKDIRFDNKNYEFYCDVC